MNDAIPLARPALSADDRRAVREVLDSGRLSGGPWTLLFEDRLAGVCGAAGAVAVSSGTAGLVLALRACGVGPGDEVITSPFTFVATVSAIHHVGAVPVLVDIDRESWNIDPAGVTAAVTRRTRAILPVHVFGRPADMPAMMDIARENGLHVIEDACEAIGSRLGGTACGAFGDAGVFGFYPNKVVVSGEGGAICSDNPGILDWCRRFRNHGRLQNDQEMGDEPGGNYRLSELHAALAASQLQRLDALISERQRLADAYRQRLADIDGLVPHAEPAGDAQVSRFAFVVRLGDDSDAARRDAVRSGLAAAGIETGHYFPTADSLPPFRGGRARIHGMLKEARALSERVIALPFFPGLEDAQIDRVVDALGAELSRPARG
jgi:perosamine synthetase